MSALKAHKARASQPQCRPGEKAEERTVPTQRPAIAKAQAKRAQQQHRANDQRTLPQRQAGPNGQQGHHPFAAAPAQKGREAVTQHRRNGHSDQRPAAPAPGPARQENGEKPFGEVQHQHRQTQPPAARFPGVGRAGVAVAHAARVNIPRGAPARRQRAGCPARKQRAIHRKVIMLPAPWRRADR
jgi:hypothetical protein